MANVTTQQEALHSFMRGAWARFAKDPIAGPGWNAVGTGLDYLERDASFDVGVLGPNGSSGVTVVKQSILDSRCAVWAPVLRQAL